MSSFWALPLLRGLLRTLLFLLSLLRLRGGLLGTLLLLLRTLLLLLRLLRSLLGTLLLLLCA